jgi:hypothetical protein
VEKRHYADGKFAPTTDRLAPRLAGMFVGQLPERRIVLNITNRQNTQLICIAASGRGQHANRDRLPAAAYCCGQ